MIPFPRTGKKRAALVAYPRTGKKRAALIAYPRTGKRASLVTWPRTGKRALSSEIVDELPIEHETGYFSGERKEFNTHAKLPPVDVDIPSIMNDEKENGLYTNQDNSELASLLSLYALNTEDIGTTCMTISMFLYQYTA